MITRDQADAQVAEYIKEKSKSIEGGVTILYSETIELNIGWVYFYQSTKHLETNEFNEALAGNAPILIKRFEGSIALLNTYDPIEDQLSRLRRRYLVDCLVNKLKQFFLS